MANLWQDELSLMRMVRCGVVVTLLLGASQVRAQSDADVSTAREIAKEGLSAYDAGRYEEASEKLSRALEVVGVPTLALYTARANAKLGRWVRAAELYLLATQLNSKGASESAQMQAQREAEQERASLLANVPRLTIVVEGANPRDVEVTLDGRLVPLSQLGSAQLVDPGDHVIVARRGGEEVKVNLSLLERETKTTMLSLASSGEPSPDLGRPDARGVVTPHQTQSGTADTTPTTSAAGGTQRTLGWVGVGVGGAGLLLGAGLGVWLLAERSRLHDAGCVGGSCYDDQRSDVNRFNHLRTLSFVGFVAGSAFTAIGATLLLSSPTSGSRGSTALVLGPGFASIEGGY
ncbi:MAG: hypothetical protein QM784_34615 [Polyangiaceae bacterium]